MFSQLTDERIRYHNDPAGALYRLVRFAIGHETYCLLTDRRDLSTFQIILLYAYRWQIELLFRFLKRTLTGLHLIRHDESGVTIQFYAMMITALLELYLKQPILDRQKSPDSDDSGHRDTLAQESETTDQQPETIDLQPPTQACRFSGVEFVTWLSQTVQKYWKIGIHWLTALRDLLACPFDERAIGILSKL